MTNVRQDIYDRGTFIVSGPATPDLAGLIDDDVLERFKNTSVYYGDIINAQLIVELRKLREALKP